MKERIQQRREGYGRENLDGEKHRRDRTNGTYHKLVAILFLLDLFEQFLP